MDKFIAKFEAVPDADLMLCEREGVAYQADMSVTVAYDEAYFEKYRSYEGTRIEAALNAGRCAMLMRNAGDGATVLDIGAGSGTFVRAAQSWGFDAKGFDINPVTVTHLIESGSYASDASAFDVVTFWDSLEHIADPDDILSAVRGNALVLVAIPIFDDLRAIRESKHYRPGEHFYYWAATGFVAWMALRGFRLVEQSAHETGAGRESIGAFAFRRDLTSSASCQCGGETQVEYFAHPKGTQWFRRCIACDSMSETATTEEQAEALPIAAKVPA